MSHPVCHCSSKIACVDYHNSLTSYYSVHHSFVTVCLLFIATTVCFFTYHPLFEPNFTRGNMLDCQLFDSDIVDCEYIDSVSPVLEKILSNDDCSIMQLNIRGIRSKEDELTLLLNKIGSSNKVSVLALNETWLRRDTTNKIKLPGYNLEHKIRKGRQGGSDHCNK